MFVVDLQKSSGEWVKKCLTNVPGVINLLFYCIVTMHNCMYLYKIYQKVKKLEQSKIKIILNLKRSREQYSEMT